MAKQFILLNGGDDWDTYRCTFHAVNHIEPGTINWGQGPQAYPCLVASALNSDNNVLSCYVYAADAMRLLCATGNMTSVPIAPIASSLSPVAATPITVVERRACDCSIAANLLAIVSELIDVGVTNKERYENKYNSFLALVDQETAASKEQIVIDGKWMIDHLQKSK